MSNENMVLIRFSKLPGKMFSIALAKGSLISDVLRAVNLKHEEGYYLRMDGEDVGVNDVVKDNSIILMCRNPF